MFVLRGQCLDEVTKVVVSHDSSGLFAAWHLAWLEVESSGQSYLFKHGDWVQSTGTSKQATVRFPDTCSICTDEAHGLLFTVVHACLICRQSYFPQNKKTSLQNMNTWWL